MLKLVNRLSFRVNSFRKKSNLPQTTNPKPQTKPAFTLIELLVVLSILSVLAGGLLFSTNLAREKGKDSRRKQDLKALSTALVAFYMDHRQYPPQSPAVELDYTSETNSSDWIPELAPYLDKVPNDPIKAGIFQRIADFASNTISQGKNYTAGIFTKTKPPPTPAQQTVTPQVAGTATVILRQAEINT